MNMKRFFLRMLAVALLGAVVWGVCAAEDEAMPEVPLQETTLAAEDDADARPEIPLQEIALVAEGESGFAAALIQARLMQLGYFEGPVDNVLGEETVAAIARFQEANGLEADGAATPQLQIALLGEGAVSAAGERFGVFDPAAELPEGSRVGNRNSKKYHLPGCGSVTEMKDKNKWVFVSREAAEAAGYEPCHNCEP